MSWIIIVVIFGVGIVSFRWWFSYDPTKNFIEFIPGMDGAGTIRKAVEEIIKIGEFANKTPSEVHDFFWPLGRSCCKEKMLCVDKQCNKEPCTFFNFVEIPEHNHCIFEGICKGSTNETYRKFWQPLVDTHYY